MKIGIIGAGAMGSVYAALLAEAGHEVHVVDIWPEHVRAIRERGLKLSGASGERTVDTIRAHSTVEEIGVCDHVIISTKLSGVEQAARSARQIADGSTAILTIQNGLGSAERAASVLGGENLMLGAAEGFGASIRGPGHAHHNSMSLIRLGEMSGGTSGRLRAIAEIWQDAGFTVRVFEDIDRLIWEKFVCNVAFSGPCTVLDMTIGELMADRYAWPIAVTCAREAHLAGRARGIRFGFDDVETYIAEFGRRMPHARPSMLLDHRSRRRSEIEAINGMVPVVAAEAGTEAPFNELISAIVRARESRFASS